MARQHLPFGSGLSPSGKRARNEAQRRRDRNAEGIKGDGNGEGVSPPQPIRGLVSGRFVKEEQWERRWAYDGGAEGPQQGAVGAKRRSAEGLGSGEGRCRLLLTSTKFVGGGIAP